MFKKIIQNNEFLTCSGISQSSRYLYWGNTCIGVEVVQNSSLQVQKEYILKVYIIVYLCIYVFIYVKTKVEYMPHA